MEAIAEAFTAFAQPLLDETDGSIEQMNKALAIGQFCFNIALMPDDSREEAITEMRLRLNMEEKEFDDFRNSVILPMIRRHETMFPRMHRREAPNFFPGGNSERARSVSATPLAKPHTGTDRYAPCPCNSGRKYKFCCGKTSR
jgi:hypothetical protein